MAEHTSTPVQRKTKTPDEIAAYKRDWHLRNRERNLKRMREYALAHAEELRAKCRTRYRARKDEYLDRSRAYRKTEAGREARRREKKRRRERHPERIRTEDKRQRERHQDKRVEYMRKYNEQNGERLRLLCRARFYAKHDECLAKKRDWDKRNPGYSSKWAKQNPDAFRAIAVKKNGKRRALKKTASVGVDQKATLARIREIKTPDTLPCSWCGTPTTKDKRHVDHVIPLSRGGHHSAENLCCACPRCNCRKRNKLPAEFLAGR